MGGGWGIMSFFFSERLEICDYPRYAVFGASTMRGMANYICINKLVGWFFFFSFASLMTRREWINWMNLITPIWSIKILYRCVAFWYWFGEEKSTRGSWIRANRIRRWGRRGVFWNSFSWSRLRKFRVPREKDAPYRIDYYLFLYNSIL